MAVAKLIFERWSAIRSQLTLYNILTIVVQIIGAFTVALWSPLFLRSVCLPSVAQYSSELHFTFTTCLEHLAGVCSFPTAHASLSEDGVTLSKGIYYDVYVDIPMYSPESHDRIGGFQVVLEGFDWEGHKTTNFRRTAFLKRSGSSVLTVVRSFLLFPFNLLGWWNDSTLQNLHIHITDRFFENIGTKTETISVQIQNRYLQINSGLLIMNARFGLLRNFLYYWPIVSSICVFFMSLSCTFSFLVLYWGFRGTFVYMRSHGLSNSGPLLYPHEARPVDEGDAVGRDHFTPSSSRYEPSNSSYFTANSTLSSKKKCVLKQDNIFYRDPDSVIASDEPLLRTRSVLLSTGDERPTLPSQ